MPDDLSIRVTAGATPEAIKALLGVIDPEVLELGDHVAQGSIERLKFAEALPEAYARLVVERRMRDDEAVRAVCGVAIRFVAISE